MAETLGSLCDQLTILKLKQWHSQDPQQLFSLSDQTHQLVEEINNYLQRAISGEVLPEKISFHANKVYQKDFSPIACVNDSFGQLLYKLAEVNCTLWHHQEKVYAFEKVPPEEKDTVIKNLATLNLERNDYIDAINKCLYTCLQKRDCEKSKY